MAVEVAALCLPDGDLLELSQAKPWRPADPAWCVQAVLFGVLTYSPSDACTTTTTSLHGLIEPSLKHELQCTR
jgi:hypothetical protein